MVMEPTRVLLMVGAALHPLQTSPVLGVSACRLSLRFPCLYHISLFLRSSLTTDKLLTYTSHFS